MTDARIAVSLNRQPNDSRVTVDSVYGILNRNGVVSTNALNRVGETDRYVGDALSPTLDAGETIVVSAFSKYTSTLPTAGDEIGGFAFESSDALVSYTVSKRGSVWINEIGADTVEFFGTTNRVMTPGWYLTLSNETGIVRKAVFDEAFDFSQNLHNGIIGIVTKTLRWMNLGGSEETPDAGSYIMELHNSSGVVEDSVSLTYPIVGSRGRIGIALWPEEGYSYDWSGTATSDVFKDWSDFVTPSFGAVNANQGFKIQTSVRIKVTTAREGGIVPYSKVVVDSIGFTNSKDLSETNTITKQSNESGLVEIELTGFATDVNNISTLVSAEAFGWKSEPVAKKFVAKSENDVVLELTPIAATDEFAKLNDYWENAGDSKLQWAVPAKNQFLQLNTSSYTPSPSKVNAGILNCKNSLSSAGKVCSLIAFDFWNARQTSRPTNWDEFKIILSTNSLFEGTLAQTKPLCNKRPPPDGYAEEVWYRYQTLLELPKGFLEAEGIYLSLRADTKGQTLVNTQVDNLRIAFQDMVTVETNGIGTVIDGAVAGSKEIKFNAKLGPWATEAGVSNVSAYVVYSLDEGLNWSTNYFAVSNVATEEKTVLEPEAYFQLTTPTNIQSVVTLEKPLEGWDSVKYYYVVDYFADNRDPDPAKQYETRYWPDNAKIDEEGRWICEGVNGYEHGIASAEIEGVPAGFTSGGQEQGTNSLTVTFRLHDEGGIDNGKIVIKKGETEVAASNYTAAVIGPGTKTFTGSITAGDLDANASYSVEITGNNGALSASSNFWTLATAAAPTIVDRSANSLKVKADGCKATKIKFSCEGQESGWLNAGSSYEFTGLVKPDHEYEVTVAVQNGAGAETPETAKASFYTLPNKPTANVTETPGWISHTISIAKLREDGFVNEKFEAFGNPSNTVYAFSVVNVDNDGKVVATNWLGETDSGLAEVADPLPKWQTLAEWDKQTFRLTLTATETNDLYLIAGGRAPLPEGCELVNGYELTEPSPEQLVKISLVVEADGEAVRVAYNSAKHDETYGVVAFTNRMMSPFAEGAENAFVVYEYTTDGGAEWKEMTLGTAESRLADGEKPTIQSKNELHSVFSADSTSNIVAATWNSAADLLPGSVYNNVKIRATIRDGKHSDVSADIPLKGGKMDYEPPTPTITLSKPTLVNGGYTRDSTLQATLGGAVAYKWKMSGDWSAETTSTTISKSGLGEVAHTLTVIGRDEWGNWTLEAGATEKAWVVDVTAPKAVIAAPEAGLALTNNLEFIPGFRLTLNDANFKNPSLTADSFECKNCTVEAVAGKAKSWTFTVRPKGDGEVTVQLKANAFDDLAGNKNGKSNLFSFVSDRTPPEVVVDCSVGLTNVSPIEFKVTLVDDNLLETTQYLAADHFEVVNGTVETLTGRGTNYVVKIRPSSENCDVSLKVKAGKFQDVAGNLNKESNLKTVVYDRIAPTVSVSSANALTNASPIVFTVTVTDNHLDSEMAYLTGASQFTVVNGSIASITGKGASYAVQVTPTADGKVSLKVKAGAFKDGAGNPNVVSNEKVVVSDRTSPTATVVGTASVTNGLPIAFKVVLADSQTNLLAKGKQYLKEAGQFTLGDGCSFVRIDETEGTNYTVWVKRTGDGVVSLKVNADAFKDEAGNGSAVSNEGKTEYDQTAPAVTVAYPVALTNASPIAFAVTVKDNHLNSKKAYLTGAGQFTIGNGKFESIEGKGSSYVVKITPAADGVVSLKVKAGAFMDEACNPNAASNEKKVVSDRTSPTATVVCTTSLTNGLPIAFKITLADSQTNLLAKGKQYLKEAGQFTLGTGCTFARIDETEGTNYTVWVTRTGDGVVSLKVKAGAFKDEAGNDSVVSNEGKTEYDRTAPVVKIGPDGVGEVTDKKSIPFKIVVTDAHKVMSALTADDFDIVATNASGAKVAVQDFPKISDFVNVKGGNTNYTFNVSSPEAAREQPIMISLTLKKAVKDEAGNVTTKAEGGVISDRTMPIVKIVTDVVSTNNAATIPYTMSVTSFSQVTNNLTAVDITVPAGCEVRTFKGVDPKNGEGVFTNYTFEVATPASVDTLMVVALPEKKVFNRAGTGNELAAANTVVSDHTAPVPVVTCTASSLTNNLSAIPFTIKVDETNGLDRVLNTLTADSVKVSDNAHVDESSFVRNSEKEYSFSVVPNGDDVGKIEVRVKAEVIADFAGNTNVESVVASVVSDRTRPTATLDTLDNEIDLMHARNDDTIAFTVTLADSQDHLSAESNYLSTASFLLDNYTVDSVTGIGKTYTAIIRPTKDGPVSVGINENAFCDLAGNGNSASAVTNFVSDRTAPTIKFDGQNIRDRHFEMKVSATDTPETTKAIDYMWSVVGDGQTFGNDWTTTETNKLVTLRGTGLNDGVWNWTVKFRDVAGNVATTNGSWTVKTDVAPELELTPTTGTVVGPQATPLVFTLKANGDLKLTETLKPDMVQHVSRDQVFYRQEVAIASDSLATITLTPAKQDRDFADEVTLTVPCGAATGTNGIAAAGLSSTVTFKFSGTNTKPEAVRIVRAACGYQDDPHRTNGNIGEITLIAKTLNGAKFNSSFAKAMISGANVKTAAVAADGLSATITLADDAWQQLEDIDGWKGFNLVFAGGSVESLPSPIAEGTPVTVPVKIWRNLARVTGANGAVVKVDGKDAPLAHDGDVRTAPVEGSVALSATFPRARVNAAYIRLSAASAKADYKPTQAVVTLKSEGKVLETFVTDLVWDGKRCAPVNLLVTPQDQLVGEAIADEAALSFTGSTAALYLDEFVVFGIPEAVDPLYPEILSVSPASGGFVVQTDMGVSNWVQALELESNGATTGVAIDWANIGWADATRMSLMVPVLGQAEAGYVGSATLHVKDGFLQNFVGRGNVGETISAATLAWNSETVPTVMSFKRYGGAGEGVAFGVDAISWELVFNQPVLNLSGKSFDKSDALGAVQILGTASPTNYIVRAQLNCWTNAVSDVKVTLKAGEVTGLTGKSNAADKASEAYTLEKIEVVK